MAVQKVIHKKQRAEYHENTVGLGDAFISHVSITARKQKTFTT
jgi:hypothetical protein